MRIVTLMRLAVVSLLLAAPLMSVAYAKPSGGHAGGGHEGTRGRVSSYGSRNPGETVYGPYDTNLKEAAARRSAGSEF